MNDSTESSNTEFEDYLERERMRVFEHKAAEVPEWDLKATKEEAPGKGQLTSGLNSKNLERNTPKQVEIQASLTPGPTRTEGRNRPLSAQPTSFPAEVVYYDGPGGSYLVDGGRAFFRWSRKAPIVNGIARWLVANGEHAEVAQKTARLLASDRELDGCVQWSGCIAGCRRGLHTDQNGLPILITSEASLPDPAPGPMPIITGIIRDAFRDETPRTVFLGWAAARYRAVASGVRQPAPMLVIAGEVNSGKSLLAWIVGQLLGGRVASPHAAWTGGMLWNDDLVGAELLLIDDAVASTDIRSRRNLGASFKEAIYGPHVQLRKRHASSITVSPVWSVMICCNSTPESLLIIPPVDSDLDDKVALLNAGKVNLPVDTSTPEGRIELQELIKAELPAFASMLSRFKVPDHLHDSRSGIKAWRDPDLAAALDATSPCRRLEELLTVAIGNRGIWYDLPCILSASEVESRLTDPGSSVRDQARALFSYSAAAGSYLSRLARAGSDRVALADPDRHSKSARYLIRP